MYTKSNPTYYSKLNNNSNPFRFRRIGKSNLVKYFTILFIIIIISLTLYIIAYNQYNRNNNFVKLDNKEVDSEVLRFEDNVANLIPVKDLQNLKEQAAQQEVVIEPAAGAGLELEPEQREIEHVVENNNQIQNIDEPGPAAIVQNPKESVVEIKNVPPPLKSPNENKKKKKRICTSAIGTLKGHKNHNVGNLDFANPFTPTPGWTEPILYEWKSNQAYPLQLDRMVEEEEEDQADKLAEAENGLPDGAIEENDPAVLGIINEVEKDPAEEVCNAPEPKLVGKLSLDEYLQNYKMEEIVTKHFEVQVGGHWAPAPKDDQVQLSDKCPKVAIIIPYRDRYSHLKIVLNVLHSLLQRQQVNYHIFVAEQFGSNTFSRGIISNAAFIVAMKQAKFDCIIFHDVDLIPENDRHLYNCEGSPRHYAVGIEKYNYTMPYDRYFGGVLAFSPEHFVLINGYPNTYWGWGGEDDDLYFRTEALKLNVSRAPPEVTRYKMLDHDNGQRWASQFVCDLLRTARTRYSLDGLSTLTFRLLSINYEELYTHLLIDVGLPDTIHYHASNNANNNNNNEININDNNNKNNNLIPTATIQSNNRIDEIHLLDPV